MWCFGLNVILRKIFLIDTICTIVDYPIYHVIQIMGYWPFYNSLLASLWSILGKIL